MIVELSSARATTTHPPQAVFSRWADPATWAEWDPEVAWATCSSPVELGARGRLKPASGPASSFTVSAFEADRVFTYTAKLPGAKLVFEHHVAATEDGIEVAVQIRLDGPMAKVWSALMGAGLRDAAASSLDGLLAHLDRSRTWQS